MSRSSAFTDWASPLGVGALEAVVELLVPAALPGVGVEVSVSSAVTPRITSATANSPATAHLKRRSQDRMRADAAFAPRTTNERNRVRTTRRLKAASSNNGASSTTLTANMYP